MSLALVPVGGKLLATPLGIVGTGEPGLEFGGVGEGDGIEITTYPRSDEVAKFAEHLLVDLGRLAANPFMNTTQ